MSQAKKTLITRWLYGVFGLVLALVFWGQHSVVVAISAPSLLAQIVPTTVNGQLDEQSDVLPDETYFQAHSLQGIAGDTVLVETTSEDFNIYLVLVGPDDATIAQDDGGGSSNARFVVTLPLTGTYQIIVNSFRVGATGAYTLSWGPATAADIVQSEVVEKIRVLNQQAHQLYQNGRYREATPLAEEVLALRQTQFSDRPLDIAYSLNALALLYQVQGRYDEAESLYLQAAAIHRQQPRENPLSLAPLLNNLASLYDDQARYDEAEHIYSQALDIYREQLGDRHLAVANSAANLAIVYFNQGRYDEAESLHLQSLEIRLEQLGESHPDTASSFNNLASLYRLQGRYDEAEPLYLKALAINREQLGEHHPTVARNLNNLAFLYQALNRYPEAESFYNQALAIFQAQLGDRHPIVLNTLNNLALLYTYQERYREAEPLYKEVLKMIREQLGDRHPNVANSLGNLAWLYHAQGRYSEAEPLYDQALAIHREQLGERHPDIAVGLKKLAELYQAEGRVEAAIATLQAGLDIEEWNLALNLANLTDSQRQAYAATIASTTNDVISLHLQAAPESSEAAQLALTTLLRRKGRIQDVGARSLQVLRQNLTPEDQTTLDALIAARQELSRLAFTPPAPLTETYRTDIARLQLEADDLEATLVRRSAAFRAEAEPVEVAAVQAQVPANGVLVEYVRYYPFNATATQLSEHYGPARYAAYLLFPDGRIAAVDLGDATPIEIAVSTFRHHLQTPSIDLPSAILDARAIDRPTSPIKALIFDPIAPYVQDQAHLLISPDSQLNRIPFEALQTEENEPYLVEQYQISYLNSGRDLLKFNIFPASTAPVVVLANPEYNAASTHPARPNSTTETTVAASDRRSVSLNQIRFGPLPGTAAEAAAIQTILPNATVLTANQATENALKTVQAPRILHIATHGFFLADSEFSRVGTRGLGVLFTGDSVARAAPLELVVENPLLRSGLALAGFNTRRSGREDGVLTALEASGLNLSGTQLVVLSACETGLGEIANGEGVYGLRRAFAIAGAESQLMSLWQVSDFGTQRLMAQYYEKLTAGMGRSAALRSTQIEMIQAGGQYSHPFYWSAFVVTGNWQPLDGA